MSSTTSPSAAFAAHGSETDPKSPAFQNIAYREAMMRYDLPLAFMAGTQAFRNDPALLPQFKNEEDHSYQERVSLTTVTNVYKKTVCRLASTPFAKPVTFDAEADPRVVGDGEGDDGWKANVDNRGTNVSTFARDRLQEMLQFGLTHILPNFMPNEVELMTVAQRKTAGLRPYLTAISPAALFGWKIDVVNGMPIIQELRWFETVTEDDGEFGEIEHKQIRVVRPTETLVYRLVKNSSASDGSKEWRQHGETMPVDLPESLRNQGIPLITVYANGANLVAEPPLADLAELNHKHVKSDSDMQRIIHVTCSPFLGSAGFTDSEIKGSNVGPSTWVNSLNTDGRIAWVEHSGQQIAALQQNLDKIKEDMDKMSLAMLTKGELGDVTATATAVNTAEETSELQEMVTNLAKGLDRCWQVMVAWEGDRDPEEIVTGTAINADFGLVFRGVEDIRSLIESYVKEIISHKTLLQELKNRGLLSDQIDIDEEIKAVAEEIKEREKNSLEFPPIGGGFPPKQPAIA